MKSQKLFSSVIAVVALAVVVSLSASSTTDSRWGGVRVIGGSPQWRIADGGGPVPPYPPGTGTLVADGGGPVPPYPHLADNFVADPELNV